jgi:hypothetical protein
MMGICEDVSGFVSHVFKVRIVPDKHWQAVRKCHPHCPTKYQPMKGATQRCRPNNQQPAAKKHKTQNNEHRT